MTDNPQDDQPPAVQEDQGNTMPPPLRFVLKFIMWLGVIAVVFWAGMSFLLNHFLKSNFELFAMGMLQTPVKIHGGVRLGKDFTKPSMVLQDIVAGVDRKSATLTLEHLEVGMPWQRIDPDKIETLSFFIKVDDLHVEGKNYGSYEIPVSMLPGGDYEVKGMKGRIKDAGFTGEVTRKGGLMTAEGEAQGLDYSHFMQGARGGRLQARASLSAATAASSDRISEMLPTLKGTLTIAGGAGVMEDNGLNFWAGDLVKSLFTPAEKETKITCAVADFVIDKGVAYARTFIIDTEKVTIFGKGNIDFANQRIDMIMTPKPRSAALLSLATPIVIEGPFNAVTTTPDPAGLAEKMGGVLLGMISPQAATILSFLKSGTGEDCAKYIENKNK